MSVRAYLVKRMDIQKHPTFNMWHDNELVEFFQDEADIHNTLNEGGGYISIPIEVLEKAVQKVKFSDESVKKELERDIAFLKKKGMDYAEYSCY